MRLRFCWGCPGGFLGFFFSLDPKDLKLPSPRTALWGHEAAPTPLGIGVKAQHPQPSISETEISFKTCF